MEHTKKRIKILTEGVIAAKGYINGPVLTPYYEEISVIFKMLAAGIKINEVLEDGTEVALSIANMNNNNNDKPKASTKKTGKAKAEKVTEETVEPVETAPAEETTVEDNLDTLKDENGQEVEVPAGDVNDDPAEITPVSEEVTSEVIIEDVETETVEPVETAPIEEVTEETPVTPVVEQPKYNNYNNKNKHNKKR